MPPSLLSTDTMKDSTVKQDHPTIRLRSGLTNRNSGLNDDVDQRDSANNGDIDDLLQGLDLLSIRSGSAGKESSSGTTMRGKDVDVSLLGSTTHRGEDVSGSAKEISAVDLTDQFTALRIAPTTLERNSVNLQNQDERELLDKASKHSTKDSKIQAGMMDTERRNHHMHTSQARVIEQKVSSDKSVAEQQRKDELKRIAVRQAMDKLKNVGDKNVHKETTSVTSEPPLSTLDTARAPFESPEYDHLTKDASCGDDALEAALGNLKLSTKSAASEETEEEGHWKSEKSLRDYQLRLMKEIVSKLTEGAPSLMLYLPTGGGKTAIIAHVIREFQQHSRGRLKTAVFVHRDELAWQMKRSLLDWGCPPTMLGFLKAGTAFDVRRSVQIVSIQSFAKKYIRAVPQDKQECRPMFDLIIIDEAHHAMADEYLALMQMYSEAKVLGVTATPFRLNKREVLSDVFYDQIRGPSIKDLTAQKWLVPAAFVRSSSSRGTLSRQAARNVKFLDSAASNWKRRWHQRKTLAFCLDIAHAEALRDAFARQNVQAAVITGRMRKDERDQIFDRSRTGEISVVCSVDVVSEGVDTVWVDCLMLFRPTESRGLFVQQLGRGLRPSEGKRDCIVLDEVGNVFRHGFMVTDDSLDDATVESDEKLRIFDCVRHRKCRGLVEMRNSKCFLCRHDVVATE